MSIDLRKENFDRMLKTTCKQYSKSEMDDNVFKLWYHSLKPFSFDTVSNAMSTWILTSTFMPTISDVVKLCRTLESQNQPSQIPHKIDKSKKQEFQAKLKEAISASKLTKARHPKMWAVKILARHEEGNYDSTVGLEMAREVVDNLSSKERSELGL